MILEVPNGMALYLLKCKCVREHVFSVRLREEKLFSKCCCKRLNFKTALIILITQTSN